ncbi:hypothetical protein Anas_10783 [Armadillidium nasatum]|uniref:Uncharacterized protein n=1 Tax=Armadillidium nasatum TaxID=96803 RepID=A0A5N5TD89_9CRUS|nr:hypothetical protein Anas_10783 [Armadillidium nasatum]
MNNFLCLFILQRRSELLLRHWWIFLVGVIVGILILALLSAFLYKFGFFKRKRLQKAKITKSEEPHKPLFMSEIPLADGHDHTHSVVHFANPVTVQEED